MYGACVSSKNYIRLAEIMISGGYDEGKESG